MKLVIVESPAKAKKIAEFLGQGWRVEACLGHIRDLPEADLGVDVAADFRPTYAVLPSKVNLLKRLLKAIKDAEAVYVATDPDREGEAIAWHLLKIASIPKTKPVYRALFHAITKDAVREAITHPRALDVHLVEAQQTRRIVDRLVGYLASPLAAKSLDGKFSAGRVQSVCLRLVVEREREIANFIPEAHWTLALKLSTDSVEFTANLYRVKNAEGASKTREPLDRLAALLQTAQVWVGKTGRTVKSRNPLPPFTTSSLQQAASTGLGLSPDRTMALAQTLYEQGWITYMRTDGVSVAPEAVSAARAYITREHGSDYLPPEPPLYTVKTANAQEAHEAIRPTDINHLPQDVEGAAAGLYALIWKRFVASQMSPALYAVTGAVIYAGKTHGQPFPVEFRTQGRSLLFDGFLKVYEEPIEDGEEADQDSTLIPPLKDNQSLVLVAPVVEEHQTRPPARFTEAALVQALEQRGIGRPSTFASMVKTVKDKGYVKVSRKRLLPTEDGTTLCDFLTAHFADVLAFDYTARLEEALDHVASGEITRLEVLRAFWEGFQPQLAQATEYALAQVKARHAPKPLMLRPVGE